MAKTAKSAASTGTTDSGNGVTKMDGVRKALAELGRDAPPLKIREYLKQRLGIEMTTDHISNYKSEIRKAAARRKQAGHTGTKQPSALKAHTSSQAIAPKASASSTVATSNGRSSGGISLQDIQAAKELVGRVGASQLRALIDLLAH
jgi:hypothetical protein